MDFRSSEIPTVAELEELYSAVGWTAYVGEPERLHAAVAASTFVMTARSDRRLVGLARGLSDDVSIFYLQDLLVHPDFQRTGIGTRLLAMCLERYRHVRQKVLLTDDEPHQRRIYQSFGFHDVADLDVVGLHAFVSIDGLET